MAFDPNQPFEVVDSPEVSGFDPNQPFEVVEDAPQGFAGQYVQDAQRGLADRAGSTLEALGRVAKGAYDIGAGGLQGMINITGDVGGDILSNAQLPVGERLAANLASVGKGTGRFVQSAAEGAARSGFDIGEMLRQAAVNQGLQAMTDPRALIGGPAGILTNQLANLVTGRTPSDIEVALAEKSNQDTQLNRLAVEQGLVPEFAGQQSDPGLATALSVALGLGGGGAGAKGANLAAREANLLRTAEAAVPPVINPAATPGAVPPRINLPLPTPPLATRISEAVQAPFQRAATNIAERRTEAQRIQALPQPAQRAISNGVEFRDAELFSTANQAERPIFRQMADQAEAFSRNRSGPDPALIVGNQVNQRRVELRRLLDEVGEEQGALTEALSVEPLNAQSNALSQLQNVNGLRRISIGDDGLLDFSNTTLSGSGTRAERNALQSHFNDLAGRSPYQLDLLRKEIFNTEFGKIGVTARNATLDQGLEAIRQGAADAIETVSPQYRTLNQRYARLRAPLDDMAKFFRNVEGAPENIQDLNASFLARRLTSNAPSNATLSGILENMESQLAANNVNFPVSVRRSQDALNALSRYYDITHDTSLAGQVQAARGSIPTSIKGVLSRGATAISEVAGRTNAVKRRAIRDLIDGEGIQGFADGGPVAAGQTFVAGEEGPELYTTSQGTKLLGEQGPGLYQANTPGYVLSNKYTEGMGIGTREGTGEAIARILSYLPTDLAKGIANLVPSDPSKVAQILGSLLTRGPMATSTQSLQEMLATKAAAEAAYPPL